MSARRQSTRPPASAAHVVGELIEFSPTDDRADPDGATARLAPVELTPTGTAVRVELFTGDDNQAAPG